MRWRFAETDDERQTKAALVERVNRWWARFRQREPEIRNTLTSGDAPAELGAWVKSELAAVLPELNFELGPGQGKGRLRLVITAEGKATVVLFTKAMIGLAPKLEGWAFYSYRVADPFELAQLPLQARTGGEVRGWHVIVSREDRRLRLRFLSPECSRSQNPEQLDRACVAAEALLGEQILNAWIGNIRVDPLPTRKAFLLFGRTVQVGTDDSIPVERLAERVHQLVAQMLAELPAVPLYEHLGRAPAAGAPIGNVYKLTRSSEELRRREAAGYPGQSDLLVGSQRLKQLFPAVQGPGFSSSTLSRVGETFCYLKIDGVDGLGPSYADRGGLEDALDEVLVPRKLGCTIGGGTGYRYSYVELALCDVERGVEAVRELLRTADIPRHSWILFHDAELAAEWAGIYPETPPPPANGAVFAASATGDLNS